MKVYQKDISPEEYKQKVYFTKDRWVSYYWQTRLVTETVGSGKVLEVGVGNGVVADFLKGLYEVRTVDIDERLNPDYVGSVDELSFLPGNGFELILCAEVLEHLPFERFRPALSELRRVTKKYVIISLPYWGYTFGWRFRLPLVGQKTLKLKISGLKPHIFNGQHYWEIGKRRFPLRRIRREIAGSDLKIDRSFWDLDDPYHYYFVLEK
jgi:SAM-dependent methyltransferase